jgi:hypothetical protein
VNACHHSGQRAGKHSAGEFEEAILVLAATDEMRPSAGRQSLWLSSDDFGADTEIVRAIIGADNRTKSHPSGAPSKPEHSSSSKRHSAPNAE